MNARLDMIMSWGVFWYGIAGVHSSARNEFDET